MARNELTKAIAYFRTSSGTNVGEDKDTLKRQREAVTKYAKAAGHQIIAEYSDDAVRGADPVDQPRPGRHLWFALGRRVWARFSIHWLPITK